MSAYFIVCLFTSLFLLWSHLSIHSSVTSSSGFNRVVIRHLFYKASNFWKLTCLWVEKCVQMYIQCSVAFIYLGCWICLPQMFTGKQAGRGVDSTSQSFCGPPPSRIFLLSLWLMASRLNAACQLGVRNLFSKLKMPV